MDNFRMPTKKWQDWTLLALHIALFIGLSLIIFVWRNQTTTGAIAYDDLAIGAGIALTLTALLAGTIFIKSLNNATLLVMGAGDLILMAYYLNITQAEPSLFTPIVGAFLVIGMLRFGGMWGSFYAILLLAVAFSMIVYIVGVNALDDRIDSYILPLLTLFVIALLNGIWVYVRDRYDDSALLKRMTTAKEQQLDDMRGRAHVISEMTSALTGTMSFDKILDATLDMSQISLRKNARQRVVGMVLLFRAYDETLYIANTRGLRNVDQNRTIKGKTGIVGKTLKECLPTIGENPAKDPELALFGVFKGLRSVLCIPLRAHYDNYGVVIFASEEYNAFNEDHIDTLNSIGVQATVALQNAVLYKNLMQEKERLIQMEEDARKALVRDLHDIPTQTISAVVMKIRIIMRQLEISPEEVPGELKLVEEMTLRATEEIRHVLFKLRPLVLESKGLAAALQELAEKMMKTYKQPMTVRVGADVERYVDDTQQGALFYLIEEAANNARKYAEASMITVQIARQGEVLAVRIADNGKGFDMDTANANVKGSFGMINMRERAELLDGTLTLKTGRGKGTTIDVVIPLNINSSRDQNGKYKPEKMPATKLAASAKAWMNENY